MGCRQPGQPPIVKDEHGESSQLAQQLEVAFIALCDRQLFKQSTQSVVPDSEVLQARFVPQCARYTLPYLHSAGYLDQRERIPWLGNKILRLEIA